MNSEKETTAKTLSKQKIKKFSGQKVSVSQNCMQEHYQNQMIQQVLVNHGIKIEMVSY